MPHDDTATAAVESTLATQVSYNAKTREVQMCIDTNMCYVLG